MQRTPKVSATAIVDAVAFETQKNQFRGNVFGQQGKFLDRKALQARASGFNINDNIKHVEELDAYIEAHGPLYF